MRYVFLIFGASGFLLATLAGLRAGRQPDLVLRDAALVCLATACMGRWFWGAVDRAATETASIRRRAAIAAAATENPDKPTGKRAEPARDTRRATSSIRNSP